jgi:hypothetical protein
MSVTARFNFVTQISEPFLDRLLKELYRRKAFPVEYKGETSQALATYGLTLKLSYDITLNEPTLYLDATVTGGVGFKGSIDGHLEFSAHLEPRTGEAPAPDYVLPIDAHALFDAVVALEIVKDGDNVFLQLRLSDLPDFKFDFNPDPVPAPYHELVRQMLKRALLVELRTKVESVPLTVLMQAALLGGWAAEEPVLRVMPSHDAPGFGNVTLAFNTFPNRGLGVAANLVDWTNPKHDFGIALDQTFLLQFVDRAWQRGQIPTKFNNKGQPDPQGGNEIKEIAFDFLEGKVTISLHGSIAGSDFWVHGSARPIIDNGSLLIQIFDVSVELPIWIEIVGFVVLNVFWLIVQQALSDLLGGLVGQAAQTGLNDFLASHQIQLAFSGKIPGTNLTLEAQADDIIVTADDMYSVGHVIFKST